MIGCGSLERSQVITASNLLISVLKVVRSLLRPPQLERHVVDHGVVNVVLGLQLKNSGVLSAVQSELRVADRVAAASAFARSFKTVFFCSTRAQVEVERPPEM